MTKRGLSILFFVALALQASAAALYVRPGGSINRNLAMCKPGDTLFVKEGVYHEAVVLKDGVAIIGQGDVVLDGTGLNTRLVSCDGDCVLPTLVSHLTLQNARHDQRGGAAWLRGKVTMSECVVRGCSGVQCGGVLIKGDLPEASALGARMEDCLVHNCSATGHEWPDAGGVANFDGTLSRCTIANCYGDRYGGIHSESSVYDCTFWGNRSEYGFVDPSNYVSDESISGISRADEGFEDHFFAKPWLSHHNEAPEGPHFRDPATFAGVPLTDAEQAIMLAADYRIGAPTHRIAGMPPASPAHEPVIEPVPQPLDYTVPSYIAHRLDPNVLLQPKETPYCVVATVNGDPQTRMAFCWFTNEGVTEGVVQLLPKAHATAEDFASGTPIMNVAATATTTPPLHYAISTSGLLKSARLDKHTAFRYVSHKALATDLQPGTDYSYRVGFEGHWSEPAYFRTAQAGDSSYSFIYMTDSHIQNREYIDEARLCAEAVAKHEPDARFCVFPGDFVDTGTDNNSEWEWERWFEEALRPVLRQMPLVPTDGNHDDSPLLNYTYHFNTDTSFNAYTRVRPQFAGINYAFVYGPMQLIAFSMQDFWRGEYDYAGGTSEYLTRDLGGWIRQQVAAAPDAAWRVGLVHKNLFSGSDHQRDKETPLLRATMLPVVKECGIQLVLQGHDHCYEVIGPVDNTLYFIGATCGAKRYTPLTREEMEASKHIHRVENYYDLFQHPFAQPGAPSYTRVTVSPKSLVLDTYKVLPDGGIEKFNTVTLNK